jgi:predicted alpha-1,2-mannosidase
MIGVLAVALLSAWVVVATVRAPSRASGQGPPERPADLVSTFVGSERDGNTFPGPSLPFGMVQLSPDTGHALGYRWSHDRILGFSHTHLSGIGCRAMGDISVMPTTGAVRETRRERYASRFSHASESARPGAYAVTLDRYGVRAELTATTRTGWHRYTFPATDRANVLVDVGEGLAATRGSTVRVVGDRRLEGDVSGGAFCGTRNRHTLRFVATFDRPFTAHGTWRDGATHPGSSSSAVLGRDRANGAWVTFDARANRTVVARVALSYVGIAGADRNAAAEAPGFDFDAVRARAAAAWDQALDRVRVDGGTREQRVSFYSALYRAQLTPTTFSDADGDYRGFDRLIHDTPDGRVQYANLSLWDTFRTQNQLLELIVPGVARDVQLSLLADARENGGWLPRWPMAYGETNVMTGDPATPFLVDGWSKGLLAGHEAEAFQTLWRNATGVPPAANQTLGRVGNPTYLRRGFVPQDAAHPAKGGDDDLHQGASATLEYAAADCSLALMARGLGHTAEAAALARRAQSYRTIWDRRLGTFRPRTRQGTWVRPFSASSGPGFHEGGPWQYQWLVPQDMAGLVGLLGGRAAAARELDDFFAHRELVADPAGTARGRWVTGPYAYYGQDRYNPNNEPDLHSPWAYAWTGQPWKTSDVVRAAQTLFVPRPDGLTGNDDLGTMSAWYVFSALGVYPVMSGARSYLLHAPLFPRAAVRLGGGATLAIEAPRAADPRARYVQSVHVGARDWGRTWLSHDDLLGAGTLSYDLGTRAGAPWGTRTGDAPPSACPR